MHHALNHVRFRVSPELNVVQDRVRGSRAPYMVRGAMGYLPRPEPYQVQDSS